MSNPLSRRSVLKRSALTAAALSIPWTAKSWAQVVGSNEDIRIGVAGLNGRGKSHTDAYKSMKGVRLVALCDADTNVLERERDRLNKGSRPRAASPTTGPSTRPTAAEKSERELKLTLFTDVRKMLDSKEIDALTIATPNHWHALMGIWGCQAGKDVFVEKPVSHNVWEGRKLVEAARKYDKIVASGTQSRSSGALREAFEWVRAGNIGKIKVARGLCYKRRATIGKSSGPTDVPETVDYDLWLGPAPKEPPHRRQFHYDWHWFWAYGNGDLGNQGIHQMDVARWALGKDHLAPTVFSVGGRFGYEDDGQTPNTQFVVHDYGDAMLIFEVRGLYERAGSSNMPKYKGQSVGHVIECEGGYLSGTTAYDHDDKVVKKFTEKGDDHFANFIKAVRSRKREDLNADVLEGHLSSALCHTGNVSYKLGEEAKPGEIREQLEGDKAAMETYRRFVEHLEDNEVCVVTDKATLGPVLKMDPKTERFTDNDKANALLTREYRNPFVVPENV